MAISQFKNKTLTHLSLESLGTKEKFWFRVSEDGNNRYLLKLSRQGTGEHWSEYIAYRLCEILKIPSAKYEILPLKNVEGTQTRMAVVSENLIEDGYQMVIGNQFLYEQDPLKYDSPETTTSKRYSAHTVSRVKEHLAKIKTLTLKDVDGVLKEIPKGIMSSNTKKFVRSLIKENKERILNHVQ